MAQSHTFTFRLKQLPSSLSSGTYFLLTEIVDPLSNQSVVASSQTVQMAAPFVQPEVALGNISPNVILYNNTATVTLIVTNVGNVTGSGLMAYLKVKSVTLDSQSSHISLAPHKAVKIRLRFKLTQSLETSLGSGAYLATAEVILNSVSTAITGSPFSVG